MAKGLVEKITEIDVYFDISTFFQDKVKFLQSTIYFDIRLDKIYAKNMKKKTDEESPRSVCTYTYTEDKPRIIALFFQIL